MVFKSGSGSQSLVLSGFMCGLVALTTSQMLRYWQLKIVYIVAIFESLMALNKLFYSWFMVLIRGFEILWIIYFYFEERSHKLQFA